MGRVTAKTGEVNMHEFISGGCEAVGKSSTFLDNWFETNRNPCKVCQNDKSKCAFYKELCLRDPGLAAPEPD